MREKTPSRLALILITQIIVSFLLWLFSISIFIRLGENVFLKEVVSFDSAVTSFIYQLRSPLLNSVMMAFTSLGGTWFLFLLSVLTAVYLFTKRKKDVLIFSTILYTGVIINLALKELFHRPRPELLPLINVSSYSFPSGHAMNSLVFYLTISYFIWRETKNIKLTLVASGISVILILIIGLSRIYLGVHYPSDVIAGYFGGLVWFFSAILFEKTIIFERLFKSKK